MSGVRPTHLAGDDFAAQFGALFDEHAPALHRYLTARVGPTIADDLLSEAFVLAIRYRSTFDPDRGTPRTWLYGIASNLLRRHHQDQVRHLVRADRLAGQAERGNQDYELADARMDAAAAAQALQPALAKLADLDKEVLFLHAWAELEPTQIAQALDLPAGTVRSKLSRVRRGLRMSASRPPNVEEPTATAALAVDFRSGS